MAFTEWLNTATRSGRINSPGQTLAVGERQITVRLISTQHDDPTETLAMGIERSIDGGATWQHTAGGTIVGGTTPNKPGSFLQVSATIVVSAGEQHRGFSEALPPGASIRYGLDGEVA